MSGWQSLVGMSIEFFEHDDAILYRNDVSASGWDRETGEYTKQEAEGVPFKAVIQTPSTDDLIKLPEGERTEAAITMWTTSEMFATEDANQVYADIIEYEGRKHKVLTNSFRRYGPYYKCVLGLYNQDPKSEHVLEVTP